MFSTSKNIFLSGFLLQKLQRLWQQPEVSISTLMFALHQTVYVSFALIRGCFKAPKA